MRAVAALLRLPLVTRFFVAGAAGAATLGCLGGLVVGLFVNPPTAWFAVFELGVPAAIGGGIAGLMAGLVALAVRRLRHGNQRS